MTKNFILALLMPLLYLNLAGLAVGGVWLGATSQWQLISLGVVMIFFSPYLIPVLLMPAGIFSHFMVLYKNIGHRKKERLMFVLSTAYILLFVTLLCVSIFHFVTGSVRPEAHGFILWVALLWASTTSLTPLLLWSSRDRNNIFVMTIVETAQAAILILCGVRLLGIVTSFWLSFAIFGWIMAAVIFLCIFYEEKHGKTPH